MPIALPSKVTKGLAQSLRHYAPRTALKRLPVSNGDRLRHAPRLENYNTFTLLTPLLVAKDHQSGLQGVPGGSQSKDNVLFE
eukprot:IDg731t1